ncbi:hypothetical protein [Micromonospora sp. NPDC050276]|uniref:hypothetical protein n=1 Tax=Micromonospora sp. NPDC050276 TaxID=3364278 RepID=UPI0037BA7128
MDANRSSVIHRQITAANDVESLPLLAQRPSTGNAPVGFAARTAARQSRPTERHWSTGRCRTPVLDQGVAVGNLRIRCRHQPYEITVLAVAPLCGILMMTLNVRPMSVQASMPAPIQVAWELGLIVVGVGGLLGVLWPGRLSTGLGLELASVLVLGTITGMYAVAVLIMSGRNAIVTISFVTAVTVGSLWRAAQIAIDLRRLARACAVVPYEELPAGVT